jgi:hypothetical protein
METTMTETTEVVALERHYYAGIKYMPGQTYAMAQDAVARNIERGLVFVPRTTPVDWWKAQGRILAAEPCTAKPKRQTPAVRSRRILQGCAYDPGCAAVRFHTAVNEHSIHTSAFVRWEDKNPHCSLRQYDGYKDLHAVRQLAHEADVLHCHVDYLLLGETRIQPRGDQLVIRHYHGSRPDGRSWMEDDLDAVNRAIRVGARLTHLAERPNVQWLPIPMPVRRYQKLVTARWDGTGTFRLAHSPTKRSYKGTHDWWHVCRDLQARGLPVEPVLIENRSHGEALAMKATCHAVFDSFWLGLQGSGLEGGAMGMPAIAGDASVKALYEEHLGACPYTYAPDATALAETIERLVTDLAFYVAEQERLAAYVLAIHDYQAVAERYDALLRSYFDAPARAMAEAA